MIYVSLCVCALNFHPFEEHQQSLIIHSFPFFLLCTFHVVLIIGKVSLFFPGPFNQHLVWFGLVWVWALVTLVFCLEYHRFHERA